GVCAVLIFVLELRRTLLPLRVSRVFRVAEQLRQWSLVDNDEGTDSTLGGNLGVRHRNVLSDKTEFSLVQLRIALQVDVKAGRRSRLPLLCNAESDSDG